MSGCDVCVMMKCVEKYNHKIDTSRMVEHEGHQQNGGTRGTPAEWWNKTDKNHNGRRHNTERTHRQKEVSDGWGYCKVTAKRQNFAGLSRFTSEDGVEKSKSWRSSEKTTFSPRMRTP